MVDDLESVGWLVYPFILFFGRAPFWVKRTGLPHGMVAYVSARIDIDEKIGSAPFYRFKTWNFEIKENEN